MSDENKFNLLYFESESMKGLYETMEKWQLENSKRLLSTNIQKDGSKFCCIALTNPTNLERLGGRDAAIRPVAITDGSQAEATILIASHCVDDTGHGLLPGPHENWFTWSVG